MSTTDKHTYRQTDKDECNENEITPPRFPIQFKFQRSKYPTQNFKSTHGGKY